MFRSILLRKLFFKPFMEYKQLDYRCNEELGEDSTSMEPCP